ncbi:MAG: group II intron maturase-specific domain-containing protein, partial [Bradyrhizobium sp.]
RYLGAGPSAKSRQRLKAKVHALTVPNVLPWPVVCERINNLLAGWQAYFGYGTLAGTYGDVDWYVANRVRHFLRRRHKVRSRGSRQFSTEHVYGYRNVLKLRRKSGGAPHAFV